MWIVKRDVGVFSAFRIRNEKRKCRPIGNKGNKNQQIGDTNENLFRMRDVVIQMCIAIYYPHS